MKLLVWNTYGLTVQATTMNNLSFNAFLWGEEVPFILELIGDVFLLSIRNKWSHIMHCSLMPSASVISIFISSFFIYPISCYLCVLCLIFHSYQLVFCLSLYLYTCFYVTLWQLKWQGEKQICAHVRNHGRSFYKTCGSRNEPGNAQHFYARYGLTTWYQICY